METSIFLNWFEFFKILYLSKNEPLSHEFPENHQFKKMVVNVFLCKWSRIQQKNFLWFWQKIFFTFQINRFFCRKIPHRTFLVQLVCVHFFRSFLMLSFIFLFCNELKPLKKLVIAFPKKNKKICLELPVSIFSNSLIFGYKLYCFFIRRKRCRAQICKEAGVSTWKNSHLHIVSLWMK